MMEFIVLGLVPGTKIQLTFAGVLILAMTLCLAVLVYLEKPHLISNHSLRDAAGNNEEAAA